MHHEGKDGALNAKNACLYYLRNSGTEEFQENQQRSLNLILQEKVLKTYFTQWRFNLLVILD
jgi:hypothetical protein